MKKHSRRLSAVLTALLLLLCLFPVSASAHTGIELDRLGSMKLHMSYEKEPVAGGNLLLYRVAEVVEDDGDYSFGLVSKLKSSKIELDDLEAKGLADDLYAAVKKTGLAKTAEGTFDKNGEVSFSKLKLGLYLLVQTKAADGFECIKPVLVSVPMQDGDDGYLYDIDATPKPELKKAEPTPTPSPSPSPSPKLPKTGQLNWPVPVLAVLGLALILVGVLLLLSAKRERKTP